MWAASSSAVLAQSVPSVASPPATASASPVLVELKQLKVVRDERENLMAKIRTQLDREAEGYGIEVVDVNRGGKITYHGPGQLVGYPIVRTDDVVEHVRTMERAMVSALADEGIAAHARPEDGPDYTGVWVGDDKIGSIGVHVQRGVTTHGFAINATNDLEPFGWVVACGLPDVRMVSVASVTGRDDDVVRCLRKRVAWRYAIAAASMASAAAQGEARC